MNNRMVSRKNRATGIALACAMVLALATGFTGCGSDGGGGTAALYEGVDFAKCLKVGQYKGLEAEPVEVKVELSEIADEINAALDAATVYNDLKEGDVLEYDDVANINYVGTIDGEAFEGGSAEGQDLELGSDTFIEGFESGLVGRKVGEQGIELNLTFPEDYGAEDLKGKDAMFTVDINSATRPAVPEYDLDFVKTQGEFGSIEAYEEAVKARLSEQKQQQAEAEQQQTLWNQAMANTEVLEYPQAELAYYTKVFDEQLEYYAKQNNVDKKDMMKEYYGSDDSNEVASMLEEDAKTLIKMEMLTEYIADKEGITYTEQEAADLQQQIESQGYDEKSVIRETGRDMQQYLRIELLYEKVLDFLVDNAVISRDKAVNN